MSIDVTLATESDIERWDDLVSRSPHGTPFHRYAALETYAESSGTDLRPLVGYKGEEPVGLFPLFVSRLGPVRVALSPPPNLKLDYLGPVLTNFRKLSNRKREQRAKRFLSGCLEYVDDTVSARFLHVRTGSRYTDPRPFMWEDCDVHPKYTYVVDLSRDEQELFYAFSGDARSNVRDADDHDVEVYEGGEDEISFVLDRVRERHHEQGLTYPLTDDYLQTLHDRLPEGVLRPYACRVDGDLVGGSIILEDDDSMYRWIGGAKADTTVAVSDVVAWHVMREGMGRGRSRFDLMGANKRRLSDYKAKYAPSLETYYRIKRSSAPLDFLVGAYKRVK